MSKEQMGKEQVRKGQVAKLIHCLLLICPLAFLFDLLLILLNTSTFGKISNSYSVCFAGIPVGFAVTPANRIILRSTYGSIVRFFCTFTLDVFLTTEQGRH
jgi:hypothetical protein